VPLWCAVVSCTHVQHRWWWQLLLPVSNPPLSHPPYTNQSAPTPAWSRATPKTAKQPPSSASSRTSLFTSVASNVATGSSGRSSSRPSASADCAVGCDSIGRDLGWWGLISDGGCLLSQGQSCGGKADCFCICRLKALSHRTRARRVGVSSKPPTRSTPVTNRALACSACCMSPSVICMECVS